MPALYRYLSDETTPSLAFLREAADILGVRPAWLAFGDGEPTDAEQKIANRLEFEEGGRDKASDLAMWNALTRWIGPYAEEGSIGVVEAMDAAMRLAKYQAMRDGVRPDDALVAKAVETVGRFLRSALEHSPVDIDEAPFEWRYDNLRDFTTQVCNAYKRLIPSPTEVFYTRMNPGGRSG